MIKIRFATVEELVEAAKKNFDIVDGSGPVDEYGASVWAGMCGGSFMRIFITEGGKFLCSSPSGVKYLYNKNEEFIAYLPDVESEDDLITDDNGFVIDVVNHDNDDEEDETEAADNSEEAVENENQGIAEEQANANMTEQIENDTQGIVDEQEVNMTEQVNTELTVLEAAEQYVSELREAESSGQVKDAAALRRADNSFTITAEHAADLRNWFYRTFKEFVDCEVDTKLLVNLYKMRLRATECTMNFEQYLRRYAYDLLMFNAGIVDETMPCFGDLKFINWLLTDENAYPFIKLYVDAFNTAKVIRPVLSELICIFGGEESQEQVEQSEEDLLMQLNYDEYTMKMITEARRKQLAS